MSKDPFAHALRAEIEAIIARYEALTRAHQETLAAAREHEISKLRNDLASLLADRQRARAQEAEVRAQLRASQERTVQLERSLEDTRKQLDEARRRAEILQAEARAAVDRERDEARKAKADLQALLDEAHRQLDQARAEATRRLAQVEGALREVRQEAESLSEAFASERAFVEACQAIEGTALHEALRQAFGEDFSLQPSTYAALKARRLDAILTHAFKERGRLIIAAPLSPIERAALPRLAGASGCELIEPEQGVRFSSSSMDKAGVQPDPAEEGNVLGCLMPGLRLVGTEGALVFPRVIVASG
ncbi:MAG: hypothetical protein RMJ98_21905 [Myxococcales bacterium]|nr:hypothetical protein [Polyangiaceae bacterium]MDW8251960.1 hypothetical protein [Myxococcales bacterium]